LFLLKRRLNGAFFVDSRERFEFGMIMEKNKQGLTSDFDEQLGLIVHTYNNLLAGMTGFTELALLHNSDSQMEELLGNSLHSGEDAVHFGKTLLASIGRLQISTERLKLSHLVDALDKLSINLRISNKVNKEVELQTDIEWFVECFIEMASFLVVLVESVNERADLTLVISENEQNSQVKISLFSEVPPLESKHQTAMFEVFYSTRKMFGKPGVGLAKVKGFFEQTGAKLDWIEGQGFMVQFPLEKSSVADNKTKS